jgi:hypothetical protein
VPVWFFTKKKEKTRKMVDINTRDGKTVHITANQLMLNPNLREAKGVLDADSTALAAVLMLTDDYCVPNRLMHELQREQTRRYSNIRDAECFTAQEVAAMALFESGATSAEAVYKAALTTGNTMCMRFVARAVLQTQLWRNAKK